MPRNQRLRNIEDCAKVPDPEYPKLGAPLQAYSVRGRGKREILYQGHVITSLGCGIFMDIGFDSESKALEYSAEYVVQIRRSRKF